MRLTTGHDGSQNAAELSLVLSPREWKEVSALAKFAQTGLDYDCDAPYVSQVFTYMLSQPEDIQSNRNTHAAFSAVDRMAAEAPADGTNSGDVTLALPKKEMRQLFVVLSIAADAEKQADSLYDAAREEFPYPFPDIEVAPRHYAKAFDDFLTALHEDRSLIINLTAPGSAAPRLDKQNLPTEMRIYLQDRISELITQNPEIYATDSRDIEIQTDELIEKINSLSSVRHKEEMPPPESESSRSDRPKESTVYSELKASVEKSGGSISAPLNAEQLQSQLSADQWSRMTNIDPELIEAEARRQQVPLSLRAKTLQS